MNDRTENPKRGFTKTDTAALLVFLLLAGILFAAALFTWVSEDEYYYYALAQRLTGGDRLFYDEWAYIQLTSIFLAMPYRLFTALTGGVEGLILFMRGVFITVDLALYWFFYFRLREKKQYAILAAALFCAHPFAGVLALNYYNISLFSFAVICMILCTAKKPPSRIELLVCGAAFSCAVLCTPVSAAVYALFSLAVLIYKIRKKKGKTSGAWEFLLDARNWLWMSAAVALCAAVFLVWLCCTTGISSVLETLPLLSQTNPYQSTLFEMTAVKLGYLADKFGLVNVILLPLCSAAAAAIRIADRKKPIAPQKRVLVLALTAAVIVSSFLFFIVHADIYNGLEAFLRAGAFIAFFFALTCCFLCRERDPRMTAFLIVALAASLPMDLTTNFTLLANGTLAYFPAVICARTLIGEIADDLRPQQDEHANKEKSDRKKTRSHSGVFLPRAAAAAAAAVLICETGFLVAQLDLSIFIDIRLASPLTHTASGPARGLYEYPENELLDRAEDEDLERIRSLTDGRLYVALGTSYCYFRAGLPVGNWTPLYQAGGIDGNAAFYWHHRPQNRPEYIYLVTARQRSEDVQAELDALEKVCEYELEKGAAGDIIRVLNWKK
ncbi:MAG: hypothetical protein IK118_07195 [Clostridia bacterium]|nr:hypothetical protein [Clostridia bacterium]